MLLIHKDVNIRITLFPGNIFPKWQYEDFIIEHLSANSHIIFGYDYDLLTKRKATGRGHASLVSGYCRASGKLSLFNANIKDDNIECDVYDIFSATRSKSNGFILVLKKEN